MIRYPSFKYGATIGVTAPSSGVPEMLHSLIDAAKLRLEQQGFFVEIGDTTWTQEKVRSASAQKRAKEFNQMMQDDSIQLIFPPWGGELLIEMLEYIEFENLQEKWVLGYSDVSLLMLAITLKTGMASAIGTNLIDIRGKTSDETTAMWKEVLFTKAGEEIVQRSSSKYQLKWQHDNPTEHVFHLTEETKWKTVSGKSEKISGRVLGGCIDVIRHLIGTPYGDVKGFCESHFSNEPIIWVLENCEMTTTDLRRSLVQMKLAGWFNHCTGLVFGRSPANTPVNGYTVEDVYQELAEELRIPVIYDIDFGHVPPQITFVNGAFAEIEVRDGNGIVVQRFL
ncbi:S66 family peptidase [Mangrovibacillus cuniculi]|uniref:LD-carboxypeptidase n=1 Tax=Mangrovibacillus cuniculi TaxID=2593652 RepID=A0A7S8HGA5_9BACI|nr:S66 peptidase family protein [Mangrovibacillus cuniculi]QPC47602.1 LD-carboxypeptidase [Mangrovibacillus cuniculi]